MIVAQRCVVYHACCCTQQMEIMRNVAHQYCNPLRQWQNATPVATTLVASRKLKEGQGLRSVATRGCMVFRSLLRGFWARPMSESVESSNSSSPSFWLLFFRSTLCRAF